MLDPVPIHAPTPSSRAKCPGRGSRKGSRGVQRAGGQARQAVLASDVEGFDPVSRFCARGRAVPRKLGVTHPSWLLFVQQTGAALSTRAQVFNGSFDLFLVFLDGLQDR